MRRHATAGTWGTGSLFPPHTSSSAATAVSPSGIRMIDFEASITESRRESSTSRTRYAIHVVIPDKADRRSWVVERRYYEFKRLHDALVALRFPVPTLPPRSRNFWGRTAAQLERRKESLDMYLQGVLATWKSLYSPLDDTFRQVTSLITVFLCQPGIFTSSSAAIKESKEEINNNNNNIPSEYYSYDGSHHSVEDSWTTTTTTGNVTSSSSASATTARGGGYGASGTPSRLSRGLKSLILTPSRSNHHHHHEQFPPRPPSNSDETMKTSEATQPSTTATLDDPPSTKRRKQPLRFFSLNWLLPLRAPFTSSLSPPSNSPSASRRGESEANNTRFAKDTSRHRYPRHHYPHLPFGPSNEHGFEATDGGRGVSASSRERLEEDAAGSLYPPDISYHSAPAGSSQFNSLSNSRNFASATDAASSPPEVRERLDQMVTSAAVAYQQQQHQQGNYIMRMMDDDGSEVEFSFSESEDEEFFYSPDVSARNPPATTLLVERDGGGGFGEGVESPARAIERVPPPEESTEEDRVADAYDDEDNEEDDDARATKRIPERTGGEARKGRRRRRHRHRHHHRTPRDGDGDAPDLFHGSVLSYVEISGKDESAADEEALPEAGGARTSRRRREGAVLFTITLRAQGRDRYSNGYSCVSVPPTPRGRDMFTNSWAVYTDNLLRHAERRLAASIASSSSSSFAPLPARAPQLNNNAVAGTDDSWWVDSDSEGAQSEGGFYGAAEEGQLTPTARAWLLDERRKWLESSVMARAENAERGRRGFTEAEVPGFTDRERLEGYDDEGAGEDGDVDDTGSEGWAAEAALGALGGMEAGGDWEEGQIWVGGEARPSLGEEEEEEEEDWEHGDDGVSEVDEDYAAGEEEEHVDGNTEGEDENNEEEGATTTVTLSELSTEPAAA